MNVNKKYIMEGQEEEKKNRKINQKLKLEKNPCSIRK
jgi:hypothetical protein